MTEVQPQYNKEEFARRGDHWYNQLRERIEPENIDNIVAIDIETW